MGNIFFTKLTRGIMLGALALAFSSCENDHEPVYESYGLVNKLEDNQFSITLDNGFLAYPQEHVINPSRLNDSTRLYMHFNITDEKDSTANIRIIFADTILKKPILTYDESILDSMGNDPIHEIKAWIAHGLLNLEFEYAGRYGLASSGHKHMVNLLQHPTIDGKYVFEFRHNSFGDRREEYYRGSASFPIAKRLEGVEKPVEIILKYRDSSISDRSVEIKYK